jgi:hypothetical protein
VNGTLIGLANIRFGPESPEHLAARIIWQLQCLDGSLRQEYEAGSLADASTIGELVARVNLPSDIKEGVERNLRKI